MKYGDAVACIVDQSIRFGTIDRIVLTEDKNGERKTFFINVHRTEEKFEKPFEVSEENVIEIGNDSYGLRRFIEESKPYKKAIDFSEMIKNPQPPSVYDKPLPPLDLTRSSA